MVAQHLAPTIGAIQHVGTQCWLNCRIKHCTMMEQSGTVTKLSHGAHQCDASPWLRAWPSVTPAPANKPHQ